MSHALTNYYHRIIRRQIRSGRFNNASEVVRHSLQLLEAMERGAGPPDTAFSNGRELERMLLEGLDSGTAEPMTRTRKRKIYGTLKQS